MQDYLFLTAFLGTVAFVSLTGVLMPGPVFAASVVKGIENKHAGAWIALGHMTVEIPLILGVAAGLSVVLTNVWVKIVIGIVGGTLLLYMGVRMLMLRRSTDAVKTAFPGHPLAAGIATTLTNPYVFLWWATVGAMLLMTALVFGPVGILLFIIVHESCDLGWDYLVSYTSFRSKKFWSVRTQAYVFGICGIILAVFGVYFIISALVF